MIWSCNSPSYFPYRGVALYPKRLCQFSSGSKILLVVLLLAGCFVFFSRPLHNTCVYRVNRFLIRYSFLCLWFSLSFYLFFIQYTLGRKNLCDRGLVLSCSFGDVDIPSSCLITAFLPPFNKNLGDAILILCHSASAGRTPLSAAVETFMFRPYMVIVIFHTSPFYVATVARISALAGKESFLRRFQFIMSFSPDRYSKTRSRARGKLRIGRLVPHNILLRNRERSYELLVRLSIVEERCRSKLPRCPAHLITKE